MDRTQRTFHGRWSAGALEMLKAEADALAGFEARLGRLARKV